jgi:hypothetical protein
MAESKNPEDIAGHLAERVEAEESGYLILSNAEFKPKVRRIIKETYGLHFERTPEKEWKLMLNVPESIDTAVIRQLDSVDVVKGDWKPKERRILIDAGLLVRPEDGTWVARRGDPIIEEKRMNDPFVVHTKEKFDSYTLKFYRSHGFKVTVETDYKYGCGYPSDAYDICDCYECNSDEPTGINGYDTTFEPLVKV